MVQPPLLLWAYHPLKGTVSLHPSFSLFYPHSSACFNLYLSGGGFCMLSRSFALLYFHAAIYAASYNGSSSIVGLWAAVQHLASVVVVKKGLFLITFSKFILKPLGYCCPAVAAVEAFKLLVEMSVWYAVSQFGYPVSTLYWSTLT